MNYKDFILRFFAIIGLIFIFTSGLIVWIIATGNWESYEKPEELPEKFILTLDLRTPILDQTSGFSFSLPALLEDEETQALYPLISAIKKAATDKRVKAIVAVLGTYSPALVHAQELTAALEDAKKNKKDTYIYASSYGPFGPGGTDYYLASQFKHVWLQPVGAVALTGLGLEAPFAKSALEKWGIKGDFMRREEYKSVMENVTQDAFSPTTKENLQSMYRDLATQLASGIALHKETTVAQVEKWMEEGPYTANEAQKMKLVTRLGYRDEFMKELEAKYGKKTERITAQEYLYRHAADDDDDANEEPKAHIALIQAQGVLTDEPSGSNPVSEDQVIDTDEIVDAFDTARKDDDIDAIIFRINSPGGSPVASETIRRALIIAKEAKKPVFVSMGRVAASGGYWIAMNGTRIFADPATITGSIGVVAGKPVLGGLTKKLGIKWDGFQTADNASMWSLQSSFTEKQRVRMNAMLDDTYEMFMKNVSEARKIPLDKMPDIAKGRVYTGQQALKVGLVDELGGFDKTIKAMKKELKLKEDDHVALIPLPRPQTKQEIIVEMLEEFFNSYAMVREMHGAFSQVRAKYGAVFDALYSSSGLVTRSPRYVTVP